MIREARAFCFLFSRPLRSPSGERDAIALVAKLHFPSTRGGTFMRVFMSFVAVIGVFTLTASSNGFWRHKNQEQRLTLDDITVVDKSLLKRAVGAMALGNAMEWFDFGVYSYIAVT